MSEMIVVLATVIGTGIGVAGFIYWFFRNFKLDINSKIDSLDNDIKADMRAHTARTDQLYQMHNESIAGINQRMDQANQRMDQFQQMFYDMLKAKSPRTNP